MADQQSTRVCKGCAVEFSPNHWAQVYCGLKCRKALDQRKHAARARAANKRSYWKNRESRLAARQEPARRARHIAWMREYRAARLDEFRERDRVYCDMAAGVARARRIGVEYEPVSKLAVFERAGWRCQICGCETPRELRFTKCRTTPTLDHIVPISRGGSHTYENVQLACWGCNARKRDRNMEEYRAGAPYPRTRSYASASSR